MSVLWALLSLVYLDNQTNMLICCLISTLWNIFAISESRQNEPK
jgi:hypothetical protein